MPDFKAFLATLHVPNNLAGDLSLFFFFIVLSLIFGFVFGRWKMVNILINVYIALAFVGVLPESLFAFSEYGKVGVFLVLLFALSAIDERLFDLHITSAGTDFFWRLFVMSILVTGMLVSVLLSFLPRDFALDYISSTAYGYFASPFALIFWLAMPIVSLLFINNRLK